MRTAKARHQRRRTRRAPALIVDLSSVRAQKRREQAEARVRDAMEENRAALSRLFSTGLIFTQKGAIYCSRTRRFSAAPTCSRGSTSPARVTTRR